MRRIGAFAVFVLLVAGCTSSGDPARSRAASTPPSTPSTSPVATASTPTVPVTPTVPGDVPTTGPNTNPGEKPPVEPVAATEHTAAGAKAFAVFFIKTIDWGYATTSTTYMRHYFQPSCVECRSVADAIDRDARKNHHFIGGRFRITGANQAPPLTITVKIDITAVEVVTHAGKYVGAEEAHTGYREAVSLRWQGADWTVIRMAPQ